MDESWKGSSSLDGWIINKMDVFQHRLQQDMDLHILTPSHHPFHHIDFSIHQNPKAWMHLAHGCTLRMDAVLQYDLTIPCVVSSTLTLITTPDK